MEGAEGFLWNPGAVVQHPGLAAVVGYDQPFQIWELETVSATVIVWLGRVGVTYQATSVATGETTTDAVLGLRLNAVRAGIQMRSIQFSWSKGAARRWNVFDIGVLIGGDDFRVGMVGLNPGGTNTGILGQGGSVGIVS